MRTDRTACTAGSKASSEYCELKSVSISATQRNTGRAIQPGTSYACMQYQMLKNEAAKPQRGTIHACTLKKSTRTTKPACATHTHIQHSCSPDTAAAYLHLPANHCPYHCNEFTSHVRT